MREKDIIDFIIYWVDGNDPTWREKKQQYLNTDENIDSSQARYRDWDNLRYIFRGIEKYAPWVHKVFLVTDEQVPKWINEEHPKLVCVNHSDYIPKEYLPTFSSIPIELNFHRIEGLSEQFVVFNDDFFITKELKPKDFFVDGLPVDLLAEYPVMCDGKNYVYSHELCCNANLLGKYYNRKEYKKRLKKKIINIKYGAKYWLYNMIMYYLPFPSLIGFKQPHFARPYLKSSMVELWEKEYDTLDKTCKHRFRDALDVNIYVFRMWNLLKGNFVPANIDAMGKMFIVHNSSIEACNAIENKKYKIICINDNCEDSCFEKVKEEVNKSFEKVFPQKSMFEI